MHFSKIPVVFEARNLIGVHTKNIIWVELSKYIKSLTYTDNDDNNNIDPIEKMKINVNIIGNNKIASKLNGYLRIIIIETTITYPIIAIIKFIVA